MKNLIFLISFSLIVFASCTGVKTVISGLEGEAYLEFFGDQNTFEDGVMVTVDDDINFKASVSKNKVNSIKGNVYPISKGKHSLSVAHKGQVIYQKEIFVSAQETKKIFLP